VGQVIGKVHAALAVPRERARAGHGDGARCPPFLIHIISSKR
jgi:hypothetical protein